MGNECSPASCVRPYKKPIEPKTIIEKHQIINHSICQIVLLPTHDSQDTIQMNPVTYLNSPQDDNNIRQSQQKKKVSSSLIVLQNMSTKSELNNDHQDIGVEVPEGVQKNFQSEIEGMTSSKNRKKINLQGPSEPRESLYQAWNRSDFSQSQFMMAVDYDKLFCQGVAVHQHSK